MSNFLIFALTSCSKEIKKDNYLFNYIPKLINDDCTENEIDIISSTFAKNLLNENQCFNHNFLNQLDWTFGNLSFMKKKNKNDSNSEITDITASLGEMKVYYLNAEVGISKKEIVFTVNDSVLNEINTMNDLNKIVRFYFFTKELINNDGDKSSLKLIVNEENDQNFFWKLENNVETKIRKNEDIKKIKKIKIDFSNKIPTDLNSSGFGGFLVTFNTLSGKKPITIVIKFVNGKEYKFFGDKNFYHVRLKNIFDNTLFLDKIGNKSLIEYIDENWLANESGFDWTNVELNNFALQPEKQKSKWQLKDKPFDNFPLLKMRYYRYLNQYRRQKEKKRYRWNNGKKQQNQLCCKYNAINVICENNNTTDYLTLYQKYENEECSYHLHFYQLFNGIKDLASEPFEIATDVVDINNRKINMWTNDNKPKYINLLSENKIMVKNILCERINKNFCCYYDVVIPQISIIKERNALNFINGETKYKFYLTFNLKYKNIDFYKHKIEIHYINN